MSDTPRTIKALGCDGNGIPHVLDRCTKVAQDLFAESQKLERELAILTIKHDSLARQVASQQFDALKAEHQDKMTAIELLNERGKKLTALMQELAIEQERRSETVAMCEQLRIELIIAQQNKKQS